MGIRHLKAAGIAAFLLVPAAIYISGSGDVQAQRGPQKKAAVLESVAGYKSWKLVSKPAPESASDTFRITDSSIAG